MSIIECDVNGSNSYEYSELNNIPLHGIETIEADSDTKTILTKLFSSRIFERIYNEALGVNGLKKIKIISLTKNEARALSIVNASLSYFVFNNKVYHATISFDKGRSEEEIITSLITEICNVAFIKQFHNLNLQKRQSSANQNAIARDIELLEWQSIQKGYQVAKELNIESHYYNKDMIENFEVYLNNQAISGHTAVYKTDFFSVNS